MRTANAVARATVAAGLLGACAAPPPEPPGAAAPVTAAAVVPPPPKAPIITRFDCEGELLHPPIDGVGQSALRFRLGVRADGTLEGRVEQTGPPLGLAPGPLSGRIALRYDTAGHLIGGAATVDWPHTRSGRPVELSLMRETFIPAGAPADGVSHVRRRASDHTYMTGRLSLAADAHPALTGMARASVLTASCLPSPPGAG